nr:CBS domain-containing protein [Gammaproteobacteria bacterium]
MTKPIVCVNFNDLLSVAIEKMALLSVNHIPVLEGKKLKGMISRMDILNYADDEACGIEKIMTSDLTVLSETDTIRTAVRILTTNSFNSLPIVNSDNELVGLITSKDLLGYLLEQY